MNPAVGLVAAYLLGSIPSAYVAGRVLRGVDLRTVGSGNLGATNVYREVGAGAAVAVLAADAAKGWMATALVPVWFGVSGTAWWPIAFGATSVLGHARPVFLLGRGGGKGVATTGGMFLALAPLALGAATAAFVAAVAATRYVSAGSLAAAVVLPASVAVLMGGTAPAFFASLALAGFVLWTHRSNWQRIRAGTERRVGRPGGREAER